MAAMRTTGGMQWLGVLACLCLALTLFAGCGMGSQPRPSDFLEHNDQLVQDPDDSSVWWWAKQGVDWSKYDKLLLDPVEVRIDMDHSDRVLNKMEAGKLAKEFRAIVITEIQDDYPVVDSPGPDVLRLSAALTHLKPVNPAVNIMSGTVMLMPVDFGEAAIEVKFIDSVSGELIGELKDERHAGPFTLDLGWKRWSHVQGAFEDWADDLKDALDQAHGR